MRVFYISQFEASILIRLACTKHKEPYQPTPNIQVRPFHLLLSPINYYVERSEDLNDEEEEKWFEVLPKPARQNKQLMQTPTNNMRALLEDLVLVIDIMPELLD